MKIRQRRRTLEEALGQLFMVGISGTRVASEAEFLLKKIRVGGVILFKRNYENPAQTAEFCRHLQREAVADQDLPLFISIDQEGGRVLRLGPPFTPIPAPAEMADSANPEQTLRHYAQVTAEELKLVGININLSPVLDVNLRGPEGLMASRCLGTDPELVSRLGRVYISELQRHGVMATAKHFPGIGDIELDPHHDLPVQPKDRPGLEAVELPPFQMAASLPVAAVMMTHTVYPALDGERPASLSPALITGLLRQEIGYPGLVITDDLEMGAIGNHYEIEEAVFEAFQAGADLQLICHDPDKIERAYHYLLKKLKQGRLAETRLQESVGRVLRLKGQYLRQPFPADVDLLRRYFMDPGQARSRPRL